jgi:uncharacterized membrane protein YphA (DoxX/SURF4 family)
MNTALWVTQVLLGIMMLALGFMKTFRPVEALSKFSWTTRSSEDRVRFVGFSELMIGLGLILPPLTGMTSRFTSLAAAFLCIVMILAIEEHVKYKETHEIWKNIIIILLAAFVAVGRFIPLQ